MKRIIIFLSMALFLSFGVNAQTLSTTTFSDANGNMPTVGSNFDVPVNVTSIGTVLTLTVYLQFDTAVITYTGYDTANAEPHAAVSEYVPGLIKVICGDFPNQITISDGLLVNLDFDFKGGYTPLRFGTVENPTNGYKSNILHTSYSAWNFPESNVTNGAVEGFFDNTISGGDWNTAANWSLGKVPDEHHNVTVNGSAETTLGVVAEVNDLTVKTDGELTLTNAGTLKVDGDFIIKSDATGDGSFINNGGSLTVGGNTTVERYAVNGQWHGLSSPVSGATFATTYFGDNPKVWVKKYDEPTNGYIYLTDTTALMGDMTGYFTWIQTSGSPQTYEFVGNLRSGTVSSSFNKTNTGHAFLGNPFTSAIDWNASTGWTKYHVYNAIYVYDGAAGQFMSYVAGVSINGGSQYIPMGQGFFVQVDNNFTSGGIDMTSDVCVHNPVAFKSSNENIVRLQIEDAGNVDEAVIRFADEATTGFDGNLDAHKMFSFTEGMPQIYSTNNDFMAINSLPFSYHLTIPMDVRGTDGNSMTIKATENGGKEHLYLKDKYTGIVTDLNQQDYTFTYSSAVTDRFELFFSYQGIDKPTVDNAKIYAVDNTVKVVINSGVNADISVYNLLGQKVASRVSTGTITSIAVEKTGYYLVKVNDGVNLTTKKVFIK